MRHVQRQPDRDESGDAEKHQIRKGDGDDDTRVERSSGSHREAASSFATKRALPDVTAIG